MNKKIKLFLILYVTAVSAVFSQSYTKKIQINDSTVYYKMNNGLDLFVCENHSVPLTYIEVAVRAGAVTSTVENAGLFHLYEHMMFKGNSKFKNAASVQKALNDLGVAQWNGTTGLECVNYYFTVPSDKIKEGLEFWSYAIREPLMDQKEFESEKKVVVNEIFAKTSKPEYAYTFFRNKLLFPDAPWQLDPGGTKDIIENCTVEDLLKIKEDFYVAGNSAVFVGGDCDPEKVCDLVNQTFGQWEQGDVLKTESYCAYQNPSPFDKPKLVVFPYDQIPDNICNIIMTYRGPDSDLDWDGTYAADLLSSYCSDPASSFVQTFMNQKGLNIPSPEYVGLGYATRRRSGVFNVESTVLKKPGESPLTQIQLFTDTFKDKIIPMCLSDENLIPADKMELIKQRFHVENIRRQETPSGILGELRFFWADAGLDYYLNYHKNVLESTNKDIASFFKTYIENKNYLLTVIVNKDAYNSKYKEEFEKNGFECITADKAFWFEDKELLEKYSNGELAARYEKNKLNYRKSSRQNISLENQKISEIKTASNSELAEYKLKNGIPVYYKKMESNNVDSVYIVIKGGTMLCEPSQSGIENGLLEMMTLGSKKYTSQDLRNIGFATTTKLGHYVMYCGSTLNMNCIDEYFDLGLDILSDAFMNPAYDEKEFNTYKVEVTSELTKKAGDPQSILFKKIHQNVYAGHPLETTVSFNEDSVKNLTIENLKVHHKKLLDSRRICVVICGKADINSALDKLNETLGTIPALDTDISMPVVKQVSPIGKKVIMEHEKCSARGFYVRVFNAPKVDDKDYITARIAASVYGENLFNLVREQKGACYTPGTAFDSSCAPVGMEYFIEVSTPDVIEYAQQARNLTAKGLLMNAEGYDKLEDRIEGFKNQYINKKYASQGTTSGVAGRITSSILQFGDVTSADEMPFKAREVTAKDVLRVFTKYWVKHPGQWYIMTGPSK